MNGTLIMLIGLPGSGKSTYAEKLKKENPDYEICSSDELRKELYGDIDDQEHNSELFEVLHNRIREYLKNGVTVVYDATNIIKKKRIHFLNSVSCKKKCVLFIEDIDDCKINNAKRDRNVPEEVIDKMRINFCPPHFNEGFDEIKVIRRKRKSCGPSITKTLEFNQENSHHQHTLGEHLIKTANAFSDEEYELKIAAYFHDLGKLHTKTNIKKDGTEDGNAHYYNHQHVSSYEFLCMDDLLEEETEMSLYIANLIYYHMHPYLSWKQSPKTKERDKKLIGEKMFNDIMKLHEADLKAH